MQTLIITNEEAGQRFDKFLKKYLREAPPGFLYKMLRKKNIKLNGAKAEGKEILREGDSVSFYLSDETLEKFRGSPVSVSAQPGGKVPGFLVNREGILILNKPAGMLVQPDGSSAVSVADALPGWLLAGGFLTEEDLRAFRPAPANRIDRNTSGIVLCGTTLNGLRVLSDAIRERRIAKTYFVLAGGTVPEDGIYTAWAEKDAGTNTVRVHDHPGEGMKEMITGIRLVSWSPSVSLFEIDLVTGRPHQIRSHLKHLHAFTAGDRKYGDPALNRTLASRFGTDRQLLHAYSVTFPEDFPAGTLAGKTVRAPLPDDFRRVMDAYGLSCPDN